MMSETRLYNPSSSARERLPQVAINPELSPGRSAHAELIFVRGGGRTLLGRQYVPYPFHITRPFHLDSTHADIATLYLQSASGGIFRADDLSLRLEVRRAARAHVTTQAATVVHDTGRFPARQGTEIVIGEEAFLAFTPDPLILFPGVSIMNDVRIKISKSAHAIISDAIAWHDPDHAGQPFTKFAQHLVITSEDGGVLATDHGELLGSDLFSAASPLGPFRSFGTVFLLGNSMRLEMFSDLPNYRASPERLIGFAALPNNAGCIVRCLARDSADLRFMLNSIFEMAFVKAIGARPAARRK